MSIVSLPLDIHIEIARHLNLHDCLVYSQLSPLRYNVVHYIFAHRNILDFTSVLNNDWQIALSDTELITILHAHTRATFLKLLCCPTFHFLLCPTYYLSLYWYNDAADTIYTCGHTNGHLKSIQCIGAFEGGASNLIQIMNTEYKSIQIPEHRTILSHVTTLIGVLSA